MKRLGLLRRALLLGLLLAAILAVTSAASADLTVHFMDIDRNDGILIVCDGETAFIDSGMFWYGQIAVDYMRSQGVEHLKYYIGSHAHRDHVGGASTIIQYMTPEAVLEPHDGVRQVILQCARDPVAIEAAKAATYVNLNLGDRFNIGGAQLEVIGPLSYIPFRNASDMAENSNSLVIRMTYGEHSFLLTGDATHGVLHALAAISPDYLKCTVYKNAHHNGAVTPIIMQATSPRYVVFSTRDKNLPAANTLKSIMDYGALPLVTAPSMNSTIVIHTDGKTLETRSVNGPGAVTLREQEVSIYQGKQAALHATAQNRNFNRLLLFRSLDPSIATVDGKGNVYGVKPGTVTVQVESVNGVEASCQVTVLPVSVQLNRETLSVRQGYSTSLRSTILPAGTRGVAVNWVSDDPSVAVVNEKGRITGVSVGTTTIRAVLNNGESAACQFTVEPVKATSVTVTPGSLTLLIGGEKQMTGRVNPKNATYPGITWQSADPSIVTIDAATGYLRAVGVGRTQIIATSTEGKERKVNVTVKPVYVRRVLVSVVGGDSNLVAGVKGRDQLDVATLVEPEDATIKDLTFRSSNPRVAVVDEKGHVTAVGVGTAYIYAETIDGSRRRISSADSRLRLRFGLVFIILTGSARKKEGFSSVILTSAVSPGRTPGQNTVFLP